MYLGARSGIIIASVSVIIGIMLGMPPLFIGLFMLVELNVYAVVAGLLRTRTSWNVYFVFFIAKILGLLALFVSVNIALGLSFDGLPPVYGSLGMFVPGIPGIILQILIVSPIVVLLEKRRDSFDY
jgi:niacin transporter